MSIGIEVLSEENTRLQKENEKLKEFLRKLVFIPDGVDSASEEIFVFACSYSKLLELDSLIGDEK